MIPCPNRLDEEDDTSAPCGDEGRQCEACYRADGERWAAYFGIRPGMTREELHNVVEQWRPFMRPEEYP